MPFALDTNPHAGWGFGSSRPQGSCRIPFRAQQLRIIPVSVTLLALVI